MSDENGQEIGVNVYDDEDELIEEIMTVTKNPDAEDNGSEDDLYEVVKAHSDQISRLTDMVESLQSQIKRIDQRQESDNKKTSSVTRIKAP
jgi:hypothetical protein